MAAPAHQRCTFRFPDDPHYTTSAHRVVADALEYQFALHAPRLLE
jgi:hypothetical protein